PEPPIDSTPNALGIREIRTDEAFTRLEYAPGELIPETTGVFFLDVESGAVEGWQHVGGLPLDTSPDNRYVEAEGVLHDRDEDRTFSWDAASLRRAAWSDGNSIAFEHLDGDGDGGSRRYVRVGPSMEPEAEFDTPAGWSIHAWRPEDGLLLTSGGLLRLETGEALSFENPGGEIHVFPSGEGFASVSSPGSSLEAQTCHVFRYNWSGILVSEVAFPCVDPPIEGAGVRLSPNGRWIAATTGALDPGTDAMGFPVLATLALFNAETGEEMVRVRGATLPALFGGTPWLAGGDALMVESVLGLHIVTVDGQWNRSPSPTLRSLWMSLAPDNPSLVGSFQAVSTLDGETLAAANFEAPDMWRGSWGSTSREFRVFRSAGGIGVASISPTLLPAIQTPPYDDALTAEVTVDTCLNVRADATTESEIVVCLPPERVVELVAHPTDGYLVRGPCVEDDLYGRCVWVHVLTEDGEQGWAYADFLRWSGIPLVPDPDPPAPRG
ncbi:MAG: SH3 domain-containing protein, partial [Dehalococcoidia bacterium]|nr:SH3 domain-containing protein [Dehalococcoidia bacterium]